MLDTGGAGLNTQINFGGDLAGGADKTKQKEQPLGGVRGGSGCR